MSGYLCRGPLWAMGLFAGLAACSEVPMDVPPSPDAGNLVSAWLVEDFDNRSQIESKTNDVILDLNQGIVSLTAENPPSLDALTGTLQFESDTDSGGLLEAEEILVTESSRITAPDTIEMRAANRIEIAGTLQAGTGGITLIAANELVIDGTLESHGPIRMFVTHPAGRIVVRGHVETRARTIDPDEPPNLELRGRGQARITGCLLTLADLERTAGSVHVDMYGDVDISGDQANVASVAVPGAMPGRTRIASQGRIIVNEGAGIGRSRDCMSESATTAFGGDIVIQGQTVWIDGPSQIGVPNAPTQGHLLHMSALDTLRFGPDSQAQSGSGASGGLFSLRAQQILLERNVELSAGAGRDQGGRVELHASEGITISQETTIRGGDGVCGPGGDVFAQVAGHLDVDESTRIWGGAANTADEECAEPHPGGSVKIEAQTISRELTTSSSEVLQGGTGETTGRTQIALDPELSVMNATNPQAQRRGTIASIPLKRAEDSFGYSVRLDVFDVETPDGTSVRLEVAGANSSEGPWSWYDATEQTSLEGLKNKSWLRYRVQLSGRDFDTPRLDYFRLDLRHLD